jgi:glycosyltransferase involved in cell wall biosynthesis
MLRLRPLVAATYHRFQRVIAVNEALASELTSLYRLKHRPVTHINNFSEVSESSSVLPADGVARFVWCGRFAHEKNVEGLLHAWSSYAVAASGVQLVLVGDGPLREELRALALSLGLGWTSDVTARQAKLVWVGKVEEPAAYISGARALLLTSHSEGLPMVILEALALGVPVLAADCPAGGVRTAMVGSGTCDPCRSVAERSPAGALLPVPVAGAPSTLALWRSAIEEMLQDASWKERRSGALQRATFFDPPTAMREWSRVLGLQPEGS